ncbi:Putative AC transposase [Linum perenne]
MIQEYQAKNVPTNEHPTSEAINPTDDDLDFALYVRNRKRLKTTPFQTELDNYLNEEIIPKSHDFDILVWWKMNGVKFPTLQAMARDLLAIPVTSVASESAFSAGGRILDPHRSKLGHDAVEAMLCTKTWVHDELRIGMS